MKKVLAWVLCLMLTLGMVSVASAEFAPVNKDDLKVGFVFIGDVSDKGYTYAHYQGLLDMQQNLGLSDDQILIKTNVSEDSSCETALRETRSALDRCTGRIAAQGDPAARAARLEYLKIYFVAARIYGEAIAEGVDYILRERDLAGRFLYSAYVRYDGQPLEHVQRDGTSGARRDVVYDHVAGNGGRDRLIVRDHAVLACLVVVRGHAKYAVDTLGKGILCAHYCVAR